MSTKLHLGIHLAFPPTAIKQALKKVSTSEEVAVYIAAAIESWCQVVLESALAVFNDPHWSSLNSRRPGLARGNVLTGPHIQVALRKDPRLQPLCAGLDPLVAVLQGFLDQSLAEMLEEAGIHVDTTGTAWGGASASATTTTTATTTNNNADNNSNNNSVNPQDTKWGRRRDDAITDVEMSLVMKRLNPSFGLGSDALLLLTALFREGLQSVLIPAATTHKILTTDDAIEPTSTLFPPPIRGRCAEAGTLALSIFRGTVVVSPNVSLRFTLLKTGGAGGGSNKDGGSGGGGGLGSGGGYAVTLPRRELLNESLNAACKALHFEDRKAAVFLFRGNAVDGTQNADDLGIIKSGIIYLVQRQWWDFQRREEARRGVLTSTKSNEAAVRGFKENATSKVALAVQQQSSSASSAFSHSPPSSIMMFGGDSSASLSSSAREFHHESHKDSATGTDLDKSEAVSLPHGGGTAVQTSGTARLARIRGLPPDQATRKLEFANNKNNSNGGGGGASSVSTGAVAKAGSPRRGSGNALSPAARAALDLSPYHGSVRPTGQHTLLSSPTAGAGGAGRVFIRHGSGGDGNIVDVPPKAAKGVLIAATACTSNVTTYLPTVESAITTLTTSLQEALGGGSTSSGSYEITDLRLLKNAAVAIQAAGKDLLVAVTAVEGVAAKRSVQEQTRKYADRVSSNSNNGSSPRNSSSPRQTSPRVSPSRSVSPVKRQINPTGGAASSGMSSGLSPLRQRAQESLRALEKAAAAAGSSLPLPSSSTSAIPSRLQQPTKRTTTTTTSVGMKKSVLPSSSSPRAGSNQGGYIASTSSTTTAPAAVVVVRHQPGSPEGKAAALNRLKGKSPPPSMVPGPPPMTTTLQPPVVVPVSTWDGPGPDYNPAPIAQVKISGAIFSSKLKFHGGPEKST